MSSMRWVLRVNRRRGCATSPTSVSGLARSATSSTASAVPDVPVHVALTAPDGSLWEWDGPAADSVRGDALDFCLVVTQRRHLDDTSLHVDGPAATEWMGIAQAFAGEPGNGRAAGQFRS